MNAKELVALLGDTLVGRLVNTLAMGAYPGGIASVLEIQPDPNAPEIVFQVHLAGWGDIGVFEHEEVTLVVPDMPVLMSRGGHQGN